MTTVSQIITDAFRVSNLLAIGTSPTTAQQDEALRYLNRIVKSVFGNEAGELLKPFALGKNNVTRPDGTVYFDDEMSTDWCVPDNVRFVCNLESARTIYLPASPDDGARFGVIDVSGNFSTTGLTINGNGRNIDGAATLALSTDGYSGEWFYREDLGNWVAYAPLTLVSTFPFPEEFDDFFITLLAVRMNPAYGAMIDEQANMIMRRAKAQLQARYQQHQEVYPELGVTRLTDMAIDRDFYDFGWGFGSSNAKFNRGYGW